MTAREDVLARIKGAAPELRTHAVKELWLFGSAAREELRAGSDIDILVDFTAPVTLFEFTRLRRYLESLLDRWARGPVAIIEGKAKKVVTFRA